MTNQIESSAKIQVLDSAGVPLPIAKEPFVIAWDGVGPVRVTATLLVDFSKVDFLASVFQLGQGRQSMMQAVVQEPNGEVSSSKEDSDSVSPSALSGGVNPFYSAVGGKTAEGETGPYTPGQVQQIADAFENLAEFSDEYKLWGSQMRSIASGVEVTLVYSHDSRYEFDLDQRYRNRQVAEAILGVLKLAIPAHEGAEHVEKS